MCSVSFLPMAYKEKLHNIISHFHNTDRLNTTEQAEIFINHSSKFFHLTETNNKKIHRDTVKPQPRKHSCGLHGLCYLAIYRQCLGDWELIEQIGLPDILYQDMYEFIVRFTRNG